MISNATADNPWFPGRTSRAGVTLIELTVVLLVIAILATITIGVTHSVIERANVAQARAELATLAAGLEKYRTQYGDFPRTGVFAFAPETLLDGGNAITTARPESQLVNALYGVLGPTMTTLAKTNDAGDEALSRSFVNPEDLTFELNDANGEPLLPTTARTQVANAILDPWGRRYQYAYMPAGGAVDWYPSFVLFSAGPDGVVDVAVAADGTPTLDEEDDDLIANR